MDILHLNRELSVKDGDIVYFCSSMGKTLYILAPYPKGYAPSQRFRFEQYLEFLEDNDYTINFYSFLTAKIWHKLYLKGSFIYKVFGFILSFYNRWILIFKLRKADAVFIHREVAQIGPPIFEWIIAKMMKIKYIYDFDDAIWLPNYSSSNAYFHRLKAYWKVKYCIRWAYCVSVGNEYLANYARQYNENVIVIPTTIDTMNHHNLLTNYESKIINIGWTGTHTTMHYLNELIPNLRKLQNKYDFQFLMISNEKPDYDLSNFSFVRWNKDSEVKDLSELSIGVMPLSADKWSEGKCGFKGLQYMALAIPTIMSPVGVNTEIIEDGVNGFLAASEDEWFEKLERLIQDKELRKAMGKAGRQTVVEKYSVEAWKGEYLRLFQSLTSDKDKV